MVSTSYTAVPIHYKHVYAVCGPPFWISNGYRSTKCFIYKCDFSSTFETIAVLSPRQNRIGFNWVQPAVMRRVERVLAKKNTNLVNWNSDLNPHAVRVLSADGLDRSCLTVCKVYTLYFKIEMTLTTYCSQIWNYFDRCFQCLEIICKTVSKVEVFGNRDWNGETEPKGISDLKLPVLLLLLLLFAHKRSVNLKLSVLMLCAPVFIFTSGSSALLGRPRCGLSI